MIGASSERRRRSPGRAAGSLGRSPRIAGRSGGVVRGASTRRASGRRRTDTPASSCARTPEPAGSWSRRIHRAPSCTGFAAPSRVRCSRPDVTCVPNPWIAGSSSKRTRRRATTWPIETGRRSPPMGRPDSPRRYAHPPRTFRGGTSAYRSGTSGDRRSTAWPSNRRRPCRGRSGRWRPETGSGWREAGGSIRSSAWRRSRCCDSFRAGPRPDLPAAPPAIDALDPSGRPGAIAARGAIDAGRPSRRSARSDRGLRSKVLWSTQPPPPGDTSTRSRRKSRVTGPRESF